MDKLSVTTLAAAKSAAKSYTDSVIASLPKGVVYKGAVNYQSDLPASPSLGDCYTVKYTGTSGTTPDNNEYVWGAYEGTNQWIKLGGEGATWGSITGTLSNQTDLQTALDAKGTYSKPADGIPSSDMTSAVQTSLGKADTALQEHQSLSAYRTSSAQDVIDAAKAGCATLTFTTSQIVSQDPLTVECTAEQIAVLEDASIPVIKVVSNPTSLLHCEYSYFVRTIEELSTVTGGPSIYFLRPSHWYDDGVLEDFGFYSIDYDKTTHQATLSNMLLSDITDDKEDTSNKVTSISSSSTDTQYPSAKAVYTAVSAKSTVSAASTGSSSTTVNYITIDDTEYKIGGESVEGFTAAEVDTIFDGVA